MLSIFLTFEVSNLDKSKVSNEENPQNILTMVVALEVLKLDKSKVVNDEQP